MGCGNILYCQAIKCTFPKKECLNYNWSFPLTFDIYLCICHTDITFSQWRRAINLMGDEIQFEGNVNMSNRTFL